MRVRWIGLALALALLGAAAGYGIGVVSRTEPTTFGAEPVPASSPSLPIDPVRPYAPDIDYPALQPDLTYQPRKIGNPGFQWAYDAPKGWVLTAQGNAEYRWRPADEPVVGGFSLRVKLVDDHLTPSQMVAQKRAAVESLYDDVEVTTDTEDQLTFTYREPDINTKRYDLFKWFATPGESEAGFEMSVVGREVDQVGLEDLLDHVASTVRRLP